MITLFYIYKSAVDGKYYEGRKEFSDPVKCLRFMHKFKKKFINFEWACDYPEDNDYLWTHWKEE